MNATCTDDAPDPYGDRPPLENDHGPDCDPGSVCVTCGGCGCGHVPRACVENGCYTIAQAEDAHRHAEMMAEHDPHYGRDLDDEEDCADDGGDDLDEFTDDHPYGEA